MWTDRGARVSALLGAFALVLATTVVAAVSPDVPAAAQSADGQPVEGLVEARERATEAAAALAALESELGELDATIAAATAEAEAAEQATTVLAEQVRQLAVDRYMQVDDVPVLPGGDINARERARVLVATVAGHNLDAMDRYRAERQRLDDARATADAARAAQSERLAEMEDRRAVLAAELARLEALEAERQAAIEAQAREEAARQEAQRQAAQRQPTTTTPPAGAGGSGGSGGSGGGTPFVPPPATGGWLCPVQGANSFIDSWMAPRAGGRWHQGVDIMSPRGTPVVLPVGGRVEFYTGGIGGLTFSLNGDDGNYYYGAHMDAYAGLAPGWYPAGTLVGYVGETGDARGTAPHLHFEIHLGGYGNAVNPYPTTRAHC